MKKIPQAVDDTLLDYLDGQLNSLEVKEIESELQQNALLRTRLEELKLITSSLKENKLEHPSKNFTASVMNRLDQYPAHSGFSMRNGILLLAGVLITIGIASLLVSAGVFDNSTTNIDLNQVELSKKYLKTPLPSFQFSGKLIINVIIVLNLGLAWLVLDRAVLKPFFQRRMQAGH